MVTLLQDVGTVLLDCVLGLAPRDRVAHEEAMHDWLSAHDWSHVAGALEGMIRRHASSIGAAIGHLEEPSDFGMMAA